MGGQVEDAVGRNREGMIKEGVESISSILWSWQCAIVISADMRVY